ncbi:MAG: hypothetical protein SNJ61_12205 [Fimbriimonadaceae bacterium]
MESSLASLAMLFAVLGIAVTVVGLVVLILWADAYVKRKQAERIAGLAEVARRRGFQFLGRPLSDARPGNFWEQLIGLGGASQTESFLARFSGFQPFGQGHSPFVGNLMAKRVNGEDWLAFDYQFTITISTGKSTTTVTYPNSVVAVVLPMHLPNLVLVRESFIGKLSEVLGARELKLEFDDFNRRYRVLTPEPEAAYGILHPEMVEHLMSIPVRTWQLKGRTLLVYEPRYLAPEEYDALIGEVEAFAGRIPEYMRDDRSLPPMSGDLVPPDAGRSN